MNIHKHILAGCTATPLAHYLKALAVLRLVASQKDPTARGYWRDGQFVLVSLLDEHALVRFFLDEYAPTPMLSPWNGGSGFYPGDNKDGFDAIRTATAPRFREYSEAIVAVSGLVGGKAARPAGDQKEQLLRRCVATWKGRSLDWLAAAFTFDGKDEPRYPALLGTGGNDGRLDFTNNFMQRLVSLFDPGTGAAQESAADLLRAALFRAVTSGLSADAVGQFLPGGAGGANLSAGFDGGALVNIWDFVLMLEGAMVLRVASLRKLDADELVQAAAPFALRTQAAGYQSATGADVSSRGEQWMPLWSQPSNLGEVEALFDEGRLQGTNGAAKNTLDASRALAGLGVARGIESFVRYGYFERNGQSNLAVPVGCVRVISRPEVRLLDQLDGFVRSLDYASRRDGAPASLAGASRSLERAMLSVSLAPTSDNWIDLLGVLGEVEQEFVRRGKSTKDLNLRPIPRLSEEWLGVLNAEHSREVRIAIAIASQSDEILGTIRENVIPMDHSPTDPGKKAGVNFASTADGLRKDPRVVWKGRSLVDDLCSIALRRVQDATTSRRKDQRAGFVGSERRKRGQVEDEQARGFPLVGKRFASLGDAQAFVQGDVDDRRIARLSRGLMSIDWKESPQQAAEDGMPFAPHALVRLTYAASRIAAFDTRVTGEARNERVLDPFLDPTPLRLLAAGRLDSAGSVLLRRLGVQGIRPRIRLLAGNAMFARRLAASTCIPISARDCSRLLAHVAAPTPKEKT